MTFFPSPSQPRLPASPPLRPTIHSAELLFWNSAHHPSRTGAHYTVDRHTSTDGATVRREDESADFAVTGPFSSLPRLAHSLHVCFINSLAQTGDELQQPEQQSPKVRCQSASLPAPTSHAGSQLYTRARRLGATIIGRLYYPQFHPRGSSVQGYQTYVQIPLPHFVSRSPSTNAHMVKPSSSLCIK